MNTLTTLCAGLCDAVLKDEVPEVGGFDLSAGLFGPNVSQWLRDTAKAIEGAAPVAPAEPCDMGPICIGCTPRNQDGACPHGPAPIAPDLDVTKILLRVVPGYEGEGLEVYAKSVDDVVALLTEQAERIEELESQRATPVVPGSVSVTTAPLTEEQIDQCVAQANRESERVLRIRWSRHLARAIEAAHGIKS